MSLFDISDSIYRDNIIRSNRQYIADLFHEMTCDDDTFYEKPYCKLVMYLSFMNDYHTFVNDKPLLMKKMKIMKKFIKFKACHDFNGRYETNLPVESRQIDENVLHASFISKELTVCHDVDAPLKISKCVYKKMLDIYDAEKQNIALQNNKKHMNNISNQFEMIQNQFSNFNKTSQNNIEDSQNIVKEIANFKNNVYHLYMTTCNVMDNFKQLCINKSKEKDRELCRQYCRNTILLNVDLMIQTLTPDVMNLIRSFVGEDMLENIRIAGVRMKYFHNSKETICNMLLKWKRKHLSNYIKEHYFMTFSLDHMSSSVRNYDGDDYMEHFHVYVNNSSHITNNSNFPCSARQYVESIVKYDISEYYHFQKDVFIISNILQQNYWK